jgi:Tfp pilus assembly protein PilF
MAARDAQIGRARAALKNARSARGAGEVDKAGYLYAHSLEWAETVEGRLGLAWSQSQHGGLEKAIAECRKARLLDPDDGRPDNDLGAYLCQLGEDERARPCFARAIEAPKNPERHFAHYNLARLDERKGDLSAAAAGFAAAMAMDEGFEAAAKALERVRRKQQA